MFTTMRPPAKVMGSSIVAHRDKEDGARTSSSGRTGGSTPHASVAVNREQEHKEVCDIDAGGFLRLFTLEGIDHLGLFREILCCTR